jgi:hypothetical protein
LAPQDTSLQETLPTEVGDLLKALEPTKQSMDLPINNAMSLLSLGEELEEDIASAIVAMIQTVPFAGSLVPTRPGTPAGPEGYRGPEGPSIGENPPTPQNITIP